MVHQFTVKERSVTNFCYKYSVTENGKWNHAQENEETILKTAEYLSVNAAVKHLDSCTWLSRFATGIKIDDLCTMSTQHTNCNLIGALYCVLINDIYPAKWYNYMLHFRCIDEVGYVKGYFRFLLYARYLLFFLCKYKIQRFRQVRRPVVYRLEFCCHLLIF